MMEIRSQLRSPIYFVEIGWAGEEWMTSQKVTLVDAKEHETIAYYDNGDNIEARESLQFQSFRSMCTARFKKDANRNMWNRPVLCTEVFQQIERRLCLNPYAKQEENEEENIMLDE